MSVDPTAAALAGGTADLTALVDAELAQLAADGAALRAMLVEDAVVTARVLPSNGMTDLLEIAGRRVAAALPPTVRPGDVLQVRVTGFDGERILVQIVGAGQANAPSAASPVAPEPAAFVAAGIVPAPPSAPQTPPAEPLPAAPSGPATPPPVQPNDAGTPLQPSQSTIRDDPARAATPSDPATRALESRGPAGPAASSPPPLSSRGFAPAIVGAPATPPGLPRPGVAPPQPNPIEARVAASRAATPPAQGALDASPPDPRPSARNDAVTRPPTREPAPPGAQRFSIPPPITPKGAPVAAPVLNAHHPAAVAGARASGLSAFTQPAALLRALRLPVTPTTLASAATALERPERLPAALVALERALPLESTGAQIATLKTLLAFVGRIDPRSPILAAQVEAYVEHVVDGAEPKLATLLAASRASVEPAAATPRTGAAQLPASVASAVAAERTMALGSDLKQTLLAVAADAASPPSLAAPLAAALTAITGVQIHAAQALAADPSGFTFTLPLATADGTANARISVKRDAERGSGVRLDGENLRVAFVLDTAHYGTVAIDVVTVGREVTLDVRTEAAPAMRAFRDALGALTSRLEALNYRVASAGAAVGTVSTVAIEAPPAAPPDADATIDRSA